MRSNSAPVKHRHKRHYTIMIVSGDSDGKNKQIHLNNIKTQILSFSIFVALLILICYIIYSSIALHNNRQIEQLQTDKINTLMSDNAALVDSNDELEAEVSQLSVALNQKVDEDKAVQDEAEVASIPKGFPVSTSAKYKSKFDNPNASADDSSAATAENGNPILVFSTSEGSQIVASGNGTVDTVTVDPKYGNCVTIDHGNGYFSIYRNKGDSLVKSGDTVLAGSPLFVVGDKNKTLGYQITLNDEYIDPSTVLEING